MDRLTNRFPCVLQDLVPFRATALLPFNLDHTHYSSKAQVPLATYCLLAAIKAYTMLRVIFFYCFCSLHFRGYILEY